jgi:putative membrane protein
LALKKGGSQKIKDFAKMMVDDHTKVNDELKALAKKKNMEVPAQLSSAKKIMSDSLTSQSGNSFDMLYMNMMLASHEETIGLFQDEATGGKDADLKKWASAKLPALKHHLEMAKKLFDKN